MKCHFYGSREIGSFVCKNGERHGMAANRIKGITIEIGDDTTKLQTALKGVNTEIRSTSSWGRLLRKQRINWRL
jgi:hypothetical protein